MNDSRRPRTLFEVEPGAHEPLADLAQAAGHEIEERLHARRQLKRRWSAYAFLLLAIAAGVTGTSALAQSHGFTRLLPLVIVGLAYLVCFVALTRALQAIPVGIAYAIWSGLGIAAITVIGLVAFGQALNAGELAGIALILVGVVVIQLYSRSNAH